MVGLDQVGFTSSTQLYTPAMFYNFCVKTEGTRAGCLRYMRNWRHQRAVAITLLSPLEHKVAATILPIIVTKRRNVV